MRYWEVHGLKIRRLSVEGPQIQTNKLTLDILGVPVTFPRTYTNMNGLPNLTGLNCERKLGLQE
jgi:hypothetical protein